MASPSTTRLADRSACKRAQALDLTAHAAELARRIASTGADVAGPHITYLIDRTGAEVSISGDLPGSGLPRSGELQFRERWHRRYSDQPWRLTEYAYELIDHERDVRVALHLHDQAWFVDTYRVVVHEHCEHPIGNVAYKHFAGTPITNSFDAVDRLLEIWTQDVPPDCSALMCLG